MTENLVIDNGAFDEVKRLPAFADWPNLDLALENCPSVFYNPPLRDSATEFTLFSSKDCRSAFF